MIRVSKPIFRFFTPFGLLVVSLLACTLTTSPPQTASPPQVIIVTVPVTVPVTVIVPVPMRVLEVAAGKPTAASGFWRHSDLSFPPSGIVDRETDEFGPCAGGGHDTHYWLLPDHQTGWVQVDLLQNYSIVKLRWLNTFNGRCGGGRATTRFHIALSPTGVFGGEEQTVYAGTMTYSVSPTYEEAILSQPSLARYVRFYVDEYYGFGGGLNELEVYAEAP